MPHARRSAERFRLTGPTVLLDHRIDAARIDVADIALADRLFSPHYVEAQLVSCVAPTEPMLSAPDGTARAVSELRLGDGFAMLDCSGGWAWGYSTDDHYVGYVRIESIGTAPASTHVIHSCTALLFAEDDIKSAVRATLPIGARVAGTVAGDFLVVAGGFLHRRHVRPIDLVDKDPVDVAQRLVGVPYRWGGRSGGGIDCSGLVQLALALCGIEAPRDSDQQRSALGEELDPQDRLRRGDLVFFPGHVGMMVDSDRLIHANAWWMAVVVEPLADVVARIAPECGAQPISRRRLA